MQESEARRFIWAAKPGRNALSGEKDRESRLSLFRPAKGLLPRLTSGPDGSSLTVSHLPQVPVSGGGDAPVPSNHLTMSEQDASWGDQGR